MQLSGPRPLVIPQPLRGVLRPRVDDFRVGGLGHGQPLGNIVDRNDAPGAEEVRAANRELTDGTASPDGHRVAGLDVGILRRHVAGR